MTHRSIPRGPLGLALALTALVLAAALAPAAGAEIITVPKHCTITGTAGDDVIHGTAGKDVICGKAGNDTIFGGGGQDFILGGPGNDKLSGGPGDDRLFGDTGNDRLSGGTGDDYVYAEAGDDTIFGGTGSDHLFDDLGDDHIDGGGQAGDLVVSGPGDDVGDNSPYTDCPAPAAQACQFDMHIDARTCPSFSSVQSTIPPCVGTTPYAPAGFAAPIFQLPVLFAAFNWFGNPHKEIQYSANIAIARVNGWSPDPGSADFNVQYAWSAATGNIGGTGMRPGVRAGDFEGPLYLNFVNGRIGADMYIHGVIIHGRGADPGPLTLPQS